MGSAVAERLLASGWQVIVWNRSPQKVAPLVELGALAAAELSDVAQAAIVITSLSSDRAIEETYFDQGLVESVLSGQGVLVDMSTVSPHMTARVALRMEGRFVAAPVQGAPQTVRDGQAGVLVAGPPELIDGLDALWSQLFASVRRCGSDPTLATKTKLVNNHLLLTGIVALAEAVAASEVLGLDPEFAAAFFKESPLVAPGLANRLDDLLGGVHEGWFTTELGAKDLALLSSATDGSGVNLSLSAAAQAVLRQAAGLGWQEGDIAAVVEVARPPSSRNQPG